MSTSESCKDKDSASKSSDDDVCDVNNKLHKLNTADNNVSICANCGKEGDNLKHCMACKLVKYCNRECQIAHRPQHKKECRKRVKELHDEKLFKEPPSQYEDCPICFLRIPHNIPGFRYYSCCGKVLCCGCIRAPRYDNHGNKVDNEKCPFCRTPHPYTVEESIERLKKRAEKDDPIAIHNLGTYYVHGQYGYQQDYKKALELWHRAAELGCGNSYTSIGIAYDNGQGVKVDKKKGIYYTELGAMLGDEFARHNLGIEEWRAGNMGRALKHFMLSVKAGDNDSLKQVQQMYSSGHATKEDYTKALQLYQAYLSEIKSPQRDKAAAMGEEYRYY